MLNEWLSDWLHWLGGVPCAVPGAAAGCTAFAVVLICC